MLKNFIQLKRFKIDYLNRNVVLADSHVGKDVNIQYQINDIPEAFRRKIVEYYKKDDININGFPISGTYSDVDNLKDNFIMKSKWKSGIRMDHEIDRQPMEKMSHDVVLPKDHAWGGLGNIQQIQNLPAVRRVIPENDPRKNMFHFPRLNGPKQNLNVNINKLQLIPPVVQYHKQPFIGDNRNIIYGLQSLNRNMVFLRQQGVSVDNRIPKKVGDSNRVPFQLPVKPQFGINVINAKMPLRYPELGKVDRPVMEIFPRKNEAIRINMYMDHKGNASYHHVNLMWEDGQRLPIPPLVLNQSAKHPDASNMLATVGGYNVKSKNIKTFIGKDLAFDLVVEESPV